MVSALKTNNTTTYANHPRMGHEVLHGPDLYLEISQVPADAITSPRSAGNLKLSMRNRLMQQYEQYTGTKKPLDQSVIRTKTMRDQTMDQYAKLAKEQNLQNQNNDNWPVL